VLGQYDKMYVLRSSNKPRKVELKRVRDASEERIRCCHGLDRCPVVVCVKAASPGEVCAESLGYVFKLSRRVEPDVRRDTLLQLGPSFCRTLLEGVG
jgi:hypothetical protein